MKYNILRAKFSALSIFLLGVALSNTPVNALTAMERCGSCHAEQVKQWQQSHHYQANALARKATVLGNFDDQTLDDKGQIIRFFSRAEKLIIAMPNAEGKVQEYPVVHSLGYVPLQQYTFETTPGKYQFFPYAWDSRPKAEGGQRWFNLYPDMQAFDQFHWTQMGQNWNQMCVECHVTDYKKNFEASTGHYSSGYSVDHVSCDACHGNSEAHLQWAAGDKNIANKGYDIYIGAQSPLFVPAENGVLKAVGELKPSEQINSCASCHSRRFAYKDRAKPHDFYDQYLPALLTAELYHLDGQIWDEDYVWGSFLQSAKYQAGVTCSNCHNPHTGNTKLSDNGLCTQCHGNEPYNQMSHLGHKAGSEGSACVDCHMPATTYMAVDDRRDHSFQIPRPDLSIETGVPNACNRCHEDKSPEWAKTQISKWHPESRFLGQAHFAQAFYAADRALPGADGELTKIAQDMSRPAIVRASALDRMSSTPGNNAIVAIMRAVKEQDPLMLQAAINAAEPYRIDDRWRMLKHLLQDKHLPIRAETARSVAELLVEPSPLSANEKKQLQTALQEYRAAQHFQADRGFAHTNLGNLSYALGDINNAEKHYQDAIKAEPIFMAAYVNLADFYRIKKDEAQAQSILKQALAVNPESNPVNYAMGMSLVRQGEKQQALAYLNKAATVGEPSVNTIYAYALLLQDRGLRKQAIEQLLVVYSHTPGNPDTSYSLSQAYFAEKDFAKAYFYARKLAALVPGNPQIKAMVEQMRSMQKAP